MKKLYFFVVSTLLCAIASAQAPANYYSSADGLTGYALKTQLKEIINSTNDGLSPEYTHNNQGDNLDGLYSISDRDIYYENDNTILDIYSENPTGTDPYTYDYGSDECGNYNSESDCYNKEHIIPQSAVNDGSPMIHDAHHVVPTDGRVNGFRSNYPFGVVDDSQLVSQSGISNPTMNGSKLGGNLNSGYSAGYTGTVFEPIDEFKGDVARMYFYFVTRYEDQVDNWSAYAMFDGTNDKAIADPFLNILLTWHQNDPVSQKEIDRNNAIFNYQNNRNPFVDNPQYVTDIWVSDPDIEAPTDPTNLVASNPTDNSIDLDWTASTDNVAVASYDVYIDGVFAYNTGNTNTSTTVTGLLADTNYCFTLKAKDTSGNESGFSNQDCETTTDNGSSGGDIDLFFSEYIEGSSNNKVLEIANFTGASVSLSIYTLKLSTNGNASWGSPYTFPSSSTIANEDVFVVANGAAAVCTSEYDDLNNAITSFNGNDAIGLFKNDVLIDIIGDFNSSANYAQNTTLVRKSTIDRPTTTFNINEWDNYASNNCDDLGSHTQTLSIVDATIKTISFYPNPVKSHLNISLKSDLETKIEIYDILGKLVFNKTISASATLDVQSLKAGIYIVKISQENSSISKRLIKN
ncbi:endonuclease [Winogradskyella pulchriflava]|uniref:Endonuclease n=1 Tax=Winogradskyella pulchriflava TaxID=1110688 RepID=A0ABV6Q9T5_9FLAO